MAKNKVSDWSSTAATNTDVGGINIAEGMLPSDVNNAMREMMAQIKDMQTGSDSDPLVVGGNLTVNGTSNLTTLSVTGNSTLGNAFDDVTTVNGTSVLIPNNLAFDTNLLYLDATNNRVGINTITPAVVFEANSTDAIRVPVGTTAQRPTGVQGYIRYNTTLGKFESYDGTSWGAVGGGATGGGSDQVFIQNSLTVTTSYSIPSGKSAMSTGPLVINSGVTVTVPSGSKWVVL